jgi:pimeloyl-ACP methyl ester carboxylesterase
MPEVPVRGVRINYETIGRSGPWIALTPGSRRRYEELINLSETIVRSGYRVLLHDRRNCGASEVAFDSSASEHEIWADDLYALGQKLGALPMYVGGSSAGARLAILYAIRHPDCLRGLLLWRLTGGQEAVDRLAENYYGEFIKMAIEGGMEAVVRSEHFSECIRARPANRERLLQTDVQHFIKTMSFWRECFLQSANLPDCGCDRSGLELNQGAGLPHCRKRSDPHPADRPESSFTNSERRAARQCRRTAFRR